MFDCRPEEDGGVSGVSDWPIVSAAMSMASSAGRFVDAVDAVTYDSDGDEIFTDERKQHFFEEAH